MALDFSKINALFKTLYSKDVSETLADVKPYFIGNVKTASVSSTYSVPVNLMPSHSLVHSKEPFSAVTYGGYSAPEIQYAKGDIVAKYFKIEVPLGIVSSLNKHGASTEGSLAYKTARYFIEDAVKVNMLLTELSYMFGDHGLPKVTSVDTRFLGKSVSSNEAVVKVNLASTSDYALMLLNNAPVTLIITNGSNETALSTTEQLKVKNFDYAAGEILLTSPVSADISAIRNARGNRRLATFSQKGNDMLGIYQLLKNSGVVQGINSDEHIGWKPVPFSSENGRLTVKKVKSAASLLITRSGKLQEDLTLFTSQETWDNLSEEIDSLRQIDYSYDKNKNVVGQKEVGIIHSNGLIRIVCHPLMKRNTAFLMSDIKSENNLLTLTTDKIIDFENNRQFQASENVSTAYVIGKMYLSPFMRNRRRHMLIEDITNV